MQKDKQLHLLAGLALSLLAGLFVYPVMVWVPWRWLQFLLTPFVVMGQIGFGLFVATVAGALKELVWDKWWKRGHPEWLDFWATALGGVIGSSVVWALFKLLGR